MDEIDLEIMFDEGVPSNNIKFISKNGDTYEGTLSEGKVTNCLQDGTKFEGSITKAKLQGQGSFHLEDGSKFVLSFEDGKLGDIAIHYAVDGTVRELHLGDDI